MLSIPLALRSNEGAVRLLLASAPHADTFGYSMPPPGLLRLGGWLERAGHGVGLEDFAFRLARGELGESDEWVDRALEWIARHGEIDVLGLSVMGATLPIALAIARAYVDRGGTARVLLGGPGTTGVDRALLARFDCIDAVVRGEAELSLCEWIDAIESGVEPRGIAGVTWRDAQGRIHAEDDRRPISDLNELADYAWHLLPPLSDYKAITGEGDGLVPIDSGRGCVYDCSFCTIGRFWSRRSRPLPAERLADEVCAVASMPAGKQAYLCHDLFAADRAHALAFCDELSRREVRVPWEVRARVDHLDTELCERMASAGCYRVLLGIESGSARVRERNAKGMRAEVDVESRIDACAAAGITPILSLILGLPGEGESELRESLELCTRVAARFAVNVSLHLVNPQPGCSLGEEFGADARALEGIEPDMAFGTGRSRVERELIAAHPDIFSTYALLPLPEEHLRELSHIAQCLPPVLEKTPRSFAALCKLRGMDTLDLLRVERDSARSLEECLSACEDPRVQALLAWERAQHELASGESLAPGEWQSCVIRSSLDLRAARDAALGSAPWPEVDSEESDYVLLRRATRVPGSDRRVTTHRVGPDVPKLLALLGHGAASECIHELAAPLRTALAQLGIDASNDWLVPPAPQHSSQRTPSAPVRADRGLDR